VTDTEKSLTIVIVDDDPAIRHVCLSILQKNYKSVFAFDKASDALDFVQKNPVDIILVDLKMPGISGHELIERVNQLNRDIVIVVITAYATIENAIEAMQKGASDFLAKPFTPDELRFAIKKALDKRELILQRARALQEKREMEENYLSFVSHQLKSPLSAAQQLLYLLEGGNYSIDNEAHEVIKRAINRISEANRLVNEWLLVSRMEKAGFTSEFVETDIVPLISYEVERYREEINKNRLEVITETPERYTIKTDPSSFSMLLSNLISNAIKYNKIGGRVIIRLRGDERFTILEVEDTGIGIKREYIPRLFSKFFRVRDEKTRNIEGTGLGLVIVKRIVDEHKGNIRVESEPDKGTKFIITLPKDL